MNKMKQQTEMERSIERYREGSELDNGQIAGASGHHQRVL